MKQVVEAIIFQTAGGTEVKTNYSIWLLNFYLFDLA
jgi:hypothetical protein